MIKDNSNYSVEDTVNNSVYRGLSDSVDTTRVSPYVWDIIYDLVHIPVRSVTHTSLRNAVGNYMCIATNDPNEHD